MTRLGIWLTHPVQYYAPWFRHLATHMEIMVYYAHRQDAEAQAKAGFGVRFDWDVPLLDGYPYRWLENIARNPGVDTFFGCDTPEVFELIRGEPFDAFLVIGWNSKSAIQTVRACQRFGVPVLMRGDSQLATPRSRLKATLKYLPYRWLLPRVDHLYTGENNRRYLRHYSVPEKRLFFAPQFVDTGFFSEAGRKAEAEGATRRIREELGIPQEAFVFAFVGKMIPKKRPGDFIQACLQAFASPDGADAHALLVGDGPLRESVACAATLLGGRVHFAGFRNQSQMPALYRACDAIVLPSDGGETWGLVVNEAMACGIPAIVSEAVGCAPDMIDDGRTGFTFPLGNVGGLAKRMLALKRLCNSERSMVRQALSQKTSAYSMERAEAGLVNAIEQLTLRHKIGDVR